MHRYIMLHVMHILAEIQTRLHAPLDSPRISSVNRRAPPLNTPADLKRACVRPSTSSRRPFYTCGIDLSQRGKSCCLCVALCSLWWDHCACACNPPACSARKRQRFRDEQREYRACAVRPRRRVGRQSPYLCCVKCATNCVCFSCVSRGKRSTNPCSICVSVYSHIEL